MTTNDMIVRLNEIQKSVYDNGFCSSLLKQEWSSICLKLRMEGFKLGKKRTDGHRVTWFLKSIEDILEKRNNRFVCEWVNKDMSPNHKHLKGNCTTRAMAYCLEGFMTYDEIEYEQYRLAEEYGRRWNSNGIWEKVMTSRGYTCVPLIRYIRRDKLAIILKNISSPIITRSSGHCAVIHNGKVIDSWDSRGGKVMQIIVKDEDKRSVLDKLKDCYD